MVSSSHMVSSDPFLILRLDRSRPEVTLEHYPALIMQPLPSSVAGSQDANEPGRLLILRAPSCELAENEV